MNPKKDLLGRLVEIEKSAVKTIAEADDIETVEALKISLIGRREGRLSEILKKISDLEPETRREVGAESNRIKNVIAEALSVARERLDLTKEDRLDLTDFTLPGRETWEASEHPVIRVIDEIWQIFRSMGFTRVRGPEIDTEWYNFEALNTPLDHPAADEQDTLYLRGSGLLRSHTSPVQIRTLEKHDPPVRVLAPGIVYRRDTYDATHTPSFHQIEGLVVDEGISFVDFKATLAEFSRRFWGPSTRVRFRPSFFPFTEPSAEVDVRRIVMKEGKEVETDWIEVMGAGMVDPNVLENVGYDPERYTGFAFGMGPGRMALLKYGIPDLRMFFQNDVRFLSQFSRDRA
ncbi:MAG: phenylalanine--tRNA ligase subunit alpha [Longimicrobiales bacterium]|jgi:phenylalanyl-tRNA synthetase alpha chain